jgi:hypothetical protein
MSETVGDAGGVSRCTSSSSDVIGEYSLSIGMRTWSGTTEVGDAGGVGTGDNGEWPCSSIYAWYLKRLRSASNSATVGALPRYVVTRRRNNSMACSSSFSDAAVVTLRSGVARPHHQHH